MDKININLKTLFPNYDAFKSNVIDVLKNDFGKDITKYPAWLDETKTFYNFELLYNYLMRHFNDRILSSGVNASYNQITNRFGNNILPSIYWKQLLFMNDNIKEFEKIANWSINGKTSSHTSHKGASTGKSTGAQADSGEVNNQVEFDSKYDSIGKKSIAKSNGTSQSDTNIDVSRQMIDNMNKLKEQLGMEISLCIIEYFECLNDLFLPYTYSDVATQAISPQELTKLILKDDTITLNKVGQLSVVSLMSSSGIITADKIKNDIETNKADISNLKTNELQSETIKYIPKDIVYGQSDKYEAVGFWLQGKVPGVVNVDGAVLYNDVDSNTKNIAKKLEPENLDTDYTFKKNKAGNKYQVEGLYIATETTEQVYNTNQVVLKDNVKAGTNITIKTVVNSNGMTELTINTTGSGGSWKSIAFSNQSQISGSSFKIPNYTPKIGDQIVIGIGFTLSDGSETFDDNYYNGTYFSLINKTDGVSCEMSNVVCGSKSGQKSVLGVIRVNGQADGTVIFVFETLTSDTSLTIKTIRFATVEVLRYE